MSPLNTDSPSLQSGHPYNINQGGAVVPRNYWRILQSDTVKSVLAASLQEKRKAMLSDSDEISHCQFEVSPDNPCNKPLGQESKDLGFKVCYTHRLCAACNQAVRPAEIDYCLNNSLPIKHARCMSIKDANGDRDGKIAIANIYRLLPDAAHSIAELDFDAKYEFLRRMQEFCAEISILVNQDKKAKSRIADKESDSLKVKQAESKREEIISKGDKVAKKHLSNAAKMIQMLTKMGGEDKRPVIVKTVYDQEIKNGRTPEQARATIKSALLEFDANPNLAEKLMKEIGI